ncbi:hypothetical protein ASG43_07860 [Aureimonas sp. Leaf454]|uniref:hypothetical protein n=1 Tax=Aureimonas sp. Leaf454 TaxID=1736381 RepID=UPI0006F74AFC|nr:hypothetical protein [Aureimonas sp. Leaf454]KQT48761.1 hypothetical protein ASG43_07860 [Aureimonas sp. Leaf454]
MTVFEWRACCEAGADRGLGRYVVHDVQEPTVAVEDAPKFLTAPLVPDRYITLHEAAHAYFFHGAGVRIAEVKVGTQNHVQAVRGSAAHLLNFEHIMSALVGDIGGRFAGGGRIVPYPDVEKAIARVRTGCHGTCDDCAAGHYALKLAGLEAPPEVSIEIWRQAEAKAYELMTEAPAYSAINRLGDALLEAGHMEGAAVHALLEPLLPFGAWLSADAA